MEKCTNSIRAKALWSRVRCQCKTIKLSLSRYSNATGHIRRVRRHFLKANQSQNKIFRTQPYKNFDRSIIHVKVKAWIGFLPGLQAELGIFSSTRSCPASLEECDQRPAQVLLITAIRSRECRRSGFPQQSKPIRMIVWTSSIQPAPDENTDNAILHRQSPSLSQQTLFFHDHLLDPTSSRPA